LLPHPEQVGFFPNLRDLSVCDAVNRDLAEFDQIVRCGDTRHLGEADLEPDQVALFIGASYEAFPDLKHNIEELIAVEDRSWCMTGSFGGWPAMYTDGGIAMCTACSLRSRDQLVRSSNLVLCSPTLTWGGSI
jgi:hypothetical protein